jgi:hypothetical protein
MWWRGRISTDQKSCLSRHTLSSRPSGSKIQNCNLWPSSHTYDRTEAQRRNKGISVRYTHDSMNTRQRCFPSALFIQSSSSFISFSYAFSESSGKVFIVCSNISSSILVTDGSVINYFANAIRTLSSADFEGQLSLAGSSMSEHVVQPWKDTKITTYLSLFDCFHSKPWARNISSLRKLILRFNTHCFSIYSIRHEIASS